MGIKDILQKQDKEAADAVMDTGHYRREAGVRHIKDIVKNPLNRLRIEFSEKFLGAKSKEDISEEYVRDLQNRLEPMFQDSEDKKAVFASHRENFEHFLQTGDLKTPLNLKDEESQFFWGTALALYAVRPEMQEKWDRRNQADRISHSTIWRRIASSSYMQQELQRHAHIVESAVEIRIPGWYGAKTATRISAIVLFPNKILSLTTCYGRLLPVLMRLQRL